MNNLIVVLMGGLSGERKISFLTGKACSNALTKKGYKVINLDAKGKFFRKIKTIKTQSSFLMRFTESTVKDGFVQSILESIKNSIYTLRCFCI